MMGRGVSLNCVVGYVGKHGGCETQDRAGKMIQECVRDPLRQAVYYCCNS
jgi:hypothetical protein